MSRKIKEFVRVEDYTTLDRLIDELTAIRRNLPADADAVLEMKGDDVFGRLFCISYFRPLTQEEAECDARYANARREHRLSVPTRWNLRRAA